MKDARLFPLRLAAEKDLGLASPLQVLLRVISERNNSKDPADEEFPLTWKMVSKWTGRGRSQCNEWIKILVNTGYIAPTKHDRHGDAAHAGYFRLVLSKCSENQAFKGLENRAFKCPENQAPHISNSLREEKLIKGASPRVTKGMENRASQATGNDGKGNSEVQAPEKRISGPEFAAKLRLAREQGFPKEEAA